MIQSLENEFQGLKMTQTDLKVGEAFDNIGCQSRGKQHAPKNQHLNNFPSSSTAQ